jgi:hypothetical protein
MNDELERMWKEAVVPMAKYCPNIRLEVLRTITKAFCQNARSANRDSNQIGKGKGKGKVFPVLH